MKISYVVGTRPNLVKLAALYRNLPGEVYHTGQHWGEMSDPFFKEYDLPQPKPLDELNGDLAVVFGDCRATLEGAMWAKKRGMLLAHVEAGLRCGDMTMPEEQNRIAVDHMSDYLFATCEDGVQNLDREKVRGQVHLVGNVVMDTMSRYGLLTLHRPFNVDNHDRLTGILDAVMVSGIDFIWPVHPRVPLKSFPPWLTPIPPQPRKEFLELLSGACIVVTDSGGVQEEAAWLGRRCLTLRPSTERPITLQYGNKLVTLESLTAEIEAAVDVPLWDCYAAERIAKILKGC